MLPLSALGFIRFDVEDFLTPESDQALAAMLESMRRAEMPGSYGIVGKKARALEARGQQRTLRLLADEPSIGFHSLSHSEHPTLAEDLAERSYDEAAARFVARERPGVEAVRDLVKAPQYFTQPGGNWVPEAVEALPQLGMDIFFTDSFNSYVEDLTAPYWYGNVLHLSFPVVNPRPFGLGLPGNLEEAVELVEAWQGRASNDAFMVMLHPTELVTREFWDAVNYAHGRTVQTLVPAPIRTPQEQAAALQAFDRYISEVRRLNIEWCDVEGLRRKIEPRRPVMVTREALRRALRRDGWGPLEVPDGTLSAAEALFALSVLTRYPERHEVSVPYVAAPSEWTEGAMASTPMASDAPRHFAAGVIDAVDRTGRLPSGRVAGLTLEQGMAALLGESPQLSFLTYIKPPERLHWDWPIFPEGFRPLRLWQDARRLAWTLKRARFRDTL